MKTILTFFFGVGAATNGAAAAGNGSAADGGGGGRSRGRGGAGAPGSSGRPPSTSSYVVIKARQVGGEIHAIEHGGAAAGAAASGGKPQGPHEKPAFIKVRRCLNRVLNSKLRL